MSAEPLPLGAYDLTVDASASVEPRGLVERDKKRGPFVGMDPFNLKTADATHLRRCTKLEMA